MKLKDKKLSLSMIIIIILCLIATGIIVSKLVKEVNTGEELAWFFQESIDTNQEIVLEDAYVLSADEGLLKFIYDRKNYEVKAVMNENYTGVADIVIDGKMVSKVRIKPDTIEGTLAQYTESSLMLEECESMEKKKEVPVYKMIGNRVEQIEWNELILGTSKIKTVMEAGVVAALLIEEETIPTDIRVLIKNKDSCFYPKIYIKKVLENTIVDVGTILSNHQRDKVTISDEKGMILCDEKGNALDEVPFEGVFHIVKTKEGLVLINELPIETYLKYVLPSEMPKSFETEALKAQAVCARTYAYSQMKGGIYAQYGANLDNTTAFQVYHNYGRYPETDAAVDATKGEVIYCNDTLITCYYFSTCAGITNDLSVWGDITADYITSVGKEITNLDLSKAKEFSTYINTKYEANDAESPYYRWEAVLDISKVHDSSKGKLLSIQVNKRNASGYITELALKYENVTEVITKENDIRQALGVYLAQTTLNNGEVRENLSMVPSACFEVTSISKGNIYLKGGGYGHGIGMSQYGANRMAQLGHDYIEIIDYYYNNIVVWNN